MRTPVKLNLGSGSQKIPGYINIDSEKSCKPDLVHDFVRLKLPYKPGSVDEIVMFHTIEHIQKKLHKPILAECYRVLRVGGRLYLSYPDFWECAKRWKDNYRGMKTFWENTIFGLQQYPSDFHVCIMEPAALEMLLRDLGFKEVKSRPEKHEAHNKVTFGVKAKGSPRLVDYEKLVGADKRKFILK